MWDQGSWHRLDSTIYHRRSDQLRVLPLASTLAGHQPVATGRKVPNAHARLNRPKGAHRHDASSARLKH